MKYNIFINQLVLSETELDLIDCAILDYLYFLDNSKNEKVIKQRFGNFTWVDYGRLIEDNPLLRIKSKGAITPRIKKIEKEGFIKVKEKRQNGHKKIFISVTSKIDSLFTKMNRNTEKPIHENEKPIHSDEKPIHENELIISTSNNTTKDNISSKQSLQVSEFINSFKEINPVYKNWFGNKTQRKACVDLLEIIELEKLLKLTKEVIPVTNTRKYAPTITTPVQLRDKLSQLQVYLQKEKFEKDVLKNNVAFN